MRNYWLKFVLASAFFLRALVAPTLAGEITIVGTGDGLETLRAVATAYESLNPGTKVNVPPSIGSGGAIAAVGADRERIGRVARALTSAEIQSGITYRPILAIPSAFYVHPDVGEIALSAGQIAEIFAGTITSWREVGGPDLRIRVVRREEADSTLQVLRASIGSFRDMRFTDRSKLAMTTQEAVDSIRDNSGAIGFAPYSAALAARLPVVRLDGRKPLDAGYPAAVTVALIYKEAQLDAETRRFVAFLSSEKARAIIREAGARPVGP